MLWLVYRCVLLISIYLLIICFSCKYVAADTSYSTNVKWGDGDQTFAEQSKAAGVDSSPGCVCAAEDRTSFLPAYDAVIDAGVTRGLSVSEVS